MATADWTLDPSDLLRVGPDFDLATFDRAATPGWDAGKQAADEFRLSRGDLLSEMQERLFAHGRTGGSKSVLLIVQGLDTAGKGGIVRHVAGMMDPQGLMVKSFGVPTEEELSHHYLWRVRRALPTAGKIGIFDRSHYEDVLVVRVDELADVDWNKRFEEINRFEKQIVDSGTTIVKVALMVSKQEQGMRLMERLQRPDKHWKYNPGDVATRSKWDDFQAAYQDMLTATSTDQAPWHVIPADSKWYSRLAVTELLTQALASLDLGWPRVRWQVETQMRRLAATMDEADVEAATTQSPALAEDVARDTAEYEEAVARVNELAQSDALEEQSGADSQDKKSKKDKKKDKKAKKKKDKKKKKKDKKKSE